MDEHAAKLRATLAELEQELRTVSQMDGETRAMLEEAVEEIQAALNVEERSDETRPGTLQERLEKAATDFDVSHPVLAGLIRRAVDALAQLGI